MIDFTALTHRAGKRDCSRERYGLRVLTQEQGIGTLWEEKELFGERRGGGGGGGNKANSSNWELTRPGNGLSSADRPRQAPAGLGGGERPPHLQLR